MQIMTKINNFEEIFFKSSIIFHVFAHRQRRTVIHNCPAFCFCTTHILIHTRGKLPYTHPHPSSGHEKNGACGDTYPACAVCLSYRRTTEANYFTSPTFIRYSAICTALSAAPLRIWSPLSHSVRPQSSARSLRTRPTYTSSRPAVSSGIG